MAIVVPQKPIHVVVGAPNVAKFVDVSVGTPGPPGPPGPEGGTPVVALPYNSWPPVNPQPDTLYLRLAP